MHLHAMGNNCHARMKFELQDVEVPRGINSESCSAATCGKAVLVMEKPDMQQAVPASSLSAEKVFLPFYAGEIASAICRADAQTLAHSVFCPMSISFLKLPPPACPAIYYLYCIHLNTYKAHTHTPPTHTHHKYISKCLLHSGRIHHVSPFLRRQLKHGPIADWVMAHKPQYL